MNDQSDSELLRLYAQDQSEAAFAELTRRYVDFVYSAARRMLRDPHMAEDVTQGTFLALARNAAQFTNGPVLCGWLHRTARNIAGQTIRTETRRRAREQDIAVMNEFLPEPAEAAWEQVAPQLDSALSQLADVDRDAVLLRYFEKKSAREIGTVLGVNEAAAQKRVNRAVERLRQIFAQQGIAVGGGALVALLAANSVQAAPATLTLTISTALAAAGSGLTSTSTITTTALKAIAMTTTQKILVSITVTVAAGLAVYEAADATKARARFAQVESQRAESERRIAELVRERDAATNQLAGLREETQRLTRNLGTLPKLRGDAARLHQTQQELSQLKADTKSAERLTRLANDPEFKQEMHDIQARVLKNQYSALFKRWQLGANEQKALLDEMADNQQRKTDRYMSMINGADITPLQTDMTADREKLYADIRASLGEDRLQEFKDFENSIADRTVLNSFVGKLGKQGLSEEQSEQLLNTMLDERSKQPLLANRSDAANTLKPFDAARGEAFFAQQEQMNQQVLARASAFLTSDQIDSLRDLQASNLVTQRKEFQREALLFGDAGQK